MGSIVPKSGLQKAKQMSENFATSVSHDALMAAYEADLEFLGSVDAINRVKGKKGPAPKARYVETFLGNCQKLLNGTAKFDWFVSDENGTKFLSITINNVKVAKGFMKLAPTATTESVIRRVMDAAQNSELFQTAIMETARECREARKEPRITRGTDGKPTKTHDQLMAKPIEVPAEAPKAAEAVMVAPVASTPTTIVPPAASAAVAVAVAAAPAKHAPAPTPAKA